MMQHDGDEYRICCDGCDARTGWSPSGDRTSADARRAGWGYGDPAGTDVRLWRCPACVRRGMFPDYQPPPDPWWEENPD